MAWDYPTTISNADPADASPVQRLLDFAARRLNAIVDSDIAGISEGGSPDRINFDADAGHTHNGTNSSLLALAGTGLFATEGAVKVASVEVDIAAISFSSNLVTGTGLTRVMEVFVGLDTPSPAGGSPAGFFGYPMVDADPNDLTFYIVLNPSGATDEVYIWNGIGSTGGGAGGGFARTFKCLMIGV